MKILPNLKLVFGALVALMLVGVAGFHFLEGWPWFDGFYMVLTTITTIGYGELHPLSPVGRIFNSFIIITGVGLVLLFFGGVTQALLEFELQSVFGRRRMDREIDRLSGHYIICGAGRVGRSVARELARKPEPFVVIDNNEAKVSRYAAEGWLAITGEDAGRCTHRKGTWASGRDDHGRDQYLHHSHRPQHEPKTPDHRPCQRRGRRKAPAHRWRGLSGFAIQLRWLPHRADVHASARG
jgi:hypothetical protein